MAGWYVRATHDDKRGDSDSGTSISTVIGVLASVAREGCGGVETGMAPVGIVRASVTG